MKAPEGVKQARSMEIPIRIMNFKIATAPLELMGKSNLDSIDCLPMQGALKKVMLRQGLFPKMHYEGTELSNSFERSYEVGFR